MDAPESNAGSNWKRRHDVSFLAMLVSSAILLIALVSYSPGESGWAAIGGGTSNAAGQVGAYLADFLYHAIGYLAYSMPLLLIARAARVFRRNPSQPSPWYFRVIGFALILLSLCSLAEFSIWQSQSLPAGPGGIIGKSLILQLQPLFGFAGSVVILLATLALGLVLFLQFSWLAFFEYLGDLLIRLASQVKNRNANGSKQASATEPDAHEAQTPQTPETSSERKPGLLSTLLERLKAKTVKTPSREKSPQRSEPLLADSTELAINDTPDWLDRSTPDLDEGSQIPTLQVHPEKAVSNSHRRVEKESGTEPMASGIIPDRPQKAASATKDAPPIFDVGTPEQAEQAPEASDGDSDIPIQPLEKRDSGPSERAVRELQGALFKSEQPLPSIALLDPPRTDQGAGFSPERLQEMSHLLVQKLADFGVKVEVTAVAPGPVITRFEIQPAPGVKASKISGLARDLARSMAMVAVRVVEVIPGKSVMGIEVPNENRAVVTISEILSSQEYDKTKSPLTIALGHDIGGNPVVTDLAKAPHMLVAGTTGSGKSVGVNAMLVSMLFKATPDELRLILVDPKMLELSVYEGIPHLLTPVITDMKEAHNGLRWSVEEMERRYQLMAAMGVRNIAGYNKKVRDAIAAGKPIADPTWRIDQSFDTTPPTLEPLPYIVIVIDEFADMMMMVGKKVEELIARIAQKARAAGIHMILATQRPSVDVITGLIKANVPTRIAFQVSSKIDSRTILDQGGAEQLLGHGDMLFMPPGNALPERVHGAFVDDDEVHRLVAEWKQRGEPEYIEEITQGGEGDGVPGLEGGDEKDDLYDQAVAFVTESGKCSISSVQRKLRIGYNRAARLVETMEAAGVVSPPAHNGAREVIARAAPQ